MWSTSTVQFQHSHQQSAKSYIHEKRCSNSFIQQPYYCQSHYRYHQGHEQSNILHRPTSVPPRFYHGNYSITPNDCEHMPELAPLPTTPSLAYASQEPSLISSHEFANYERGLYDNSQQVNYVTQPQKCRPYYGYPTRPHSAPPRYLMQSSPNFHSISGEPDFVYEFWPEIKPYYTDRMVDNQVSLSLSNLSIDSTNVEETSTKSHCLTNIDKLLNDIIQDYSVVNVSQSINLPENPTTGKLNHSQTFQVECLLDIINLHLVSSYARKEHDSHFLQQQLSIASERHKSMALEQIKDQVVELSSHVFGNYVIQKFLEYGSLEQRTQIFALLSGHVLKLTINKYGCRVIQKALEFSDLKLIIFQNIKNNIEKCIDNENGNHVIQKCVAEIPADSLTPIYELFRGRIVYFCKKMYGCRVVQRLLKNCTISYQNEMIDCILEEVIILSKDTWGNYVIQYLIEKNKSQVIDKIVPVFLDNFEELSYHKFSSNVVEQCLRNCTAESINKFIQAFLNRSNDKLVEFMTHEYGNYVIQTLLDKSTYKVGVSKIHKRLKRYGLIKRIKSQATGHQVAIKLYIKVKPFNKY